MGRKRTVIVHVRRTAEIKAKLEKAMSFFSFFCEAKGE
jgi:hypothetical protein